MRSCSAGPVIVAAKHEAAWDTFALIPLMRDPALVMKAELLSIPLYGTFCRKFELIPVQRELGPAALRQMAREARMRAAEGARNPDLPGGHAQNSRLSSRLQAGDRLSLSGPQNPGLPAGAQLRRLLATPYLPAIPRNDCRRIPGSHPAGAATPGVYAKARTGNRNGFGEVTR